MKFAPLVYDLEIVKGIALPGEERFPDIEYCRGFDDHANMGISVLAAFDYETGRTHVYFEDNLSDFLELCAQRFPIVGFNNLSFDNPVVMATLGREMESLSSLNAQSYDIMNEIWLSLRGRRKGYNLDACAAATVGIHKTGNGALAPVNWQRGRHGAVADYCIQDVHATRLLLDYVMEHGGIIDPVRGGHLPLRRPQDLFPGSAE